MKPITTEAAGIYASTEDEGIIKIHNGDAGTLVIAGKRISARIVSNGEIEQDKIKYTISIPIKTLSH